MVAHAMMTVIANITVTNACVNYQFHYGANVLVITFIHDNVVLSLIVIRIQITLVNCKKTMAKVAYIVSHVYLKTVIKEQIHVN